jgi:hypothetical protein
VENERIGGRPSLGMKNLLNRFRVKAQTTKPVDSLSRKSHEVPAPKNLASLAQGTL